MLEVWGSLRVGARFAAQLCRVSALGGTWIIVLLGAASGTVGARVDASLLLALLASTGFHVAVYVWNDVFDLSLDRTQPRRATSPLVQGAIGIRAVVMLASAAAILALAAAAVAGQDAVLWMAVALVLLLVYDAWGKRLSIPPCMDVIQGAGWAALAVYGAHAVAATTATTVWVAIYVLLGIVVINGIDGGIRDLPNDHRHRVHTTALWLGAIPTGDDGVRISCRFALYAICAQLTTVAVLFAGILSSGVGSLAPRLVLAGAGGIGGCLLLLAMLDRAPEGARSWHWGLAHIVTILVLPVLIIPGPFSLPFALVLLVMFVLPTAAVVQSVLRWRAAVQC